MIACFFLFCLRAVFELLMQFDEIFLKNRIRKLLSKKWYLHDEPILTDGFLRTPVLVVDETEVLPSELNIVFC